MNWNSSADFFAMGGYAFYVWGSFGCCAVLMLCEPWVVLRRRMAALRQVRSQHEAGRSQP
ncbi:MAG: heme exporter protein CcmD [Alcaligenaceae bacterium]